MQLHLCSEDESQHGKDNGDSQTQVQVEQDGACECYQPHQLQGSKTLTVSGVKSTKRFTQYLTEQNGS